VSRPRRRPARTSLAVRVLLVGAVFVVGLAIGAALDDNPEPGTTTIERSLSVVTLTPTR
jgi:hypothetical protein